MRDTLRERRLRAAAVAAARYGVVNRAAMSGGERIR